MRGDGGRSLRPRAGCPRLKRKAAARLPGPAGARHLPFEQDKKAAALVPDGLDLHTSQSEKDAFHAAALRSKLQLRKAPTKNLSQNGLSQNGYGFLSIRARTRSCDRALPAGSCGSG